ncbi:LPS export ABC transporter periplasmic protein LptC [Moraxella catarrhalis]|uniref:LPS export ABC transporter periplasmic protein LptC n=1 Tax=Moraxella catarrhalis TaxID=480 RepID=UPI0013D55C2D|nr:LPS export ABC transporter periplasmic protein LptC [Moraxella catarrhalis]
MNFRILSVLGIIALAVAVWFFYQEDVEVKPALPEVPTVDSEVTQIKAIQTDPKTGATEYTLTADSLIQNANGQDEMLGATIHWQPPQGETYTLTADRATLEQNSGDLRLSQGFRLVRAATADKPEMIIEGLNIIGNTKNRTVSSQDPLTVQQGMDRFKAQGFRANLQTGEYEFDHIEALFDAPKRQNQTLF